MSRLPLLAALVLALLVFAGCGDKGKQTLTSSQEQGQGASTRAATTASLDKLASSVQGCIEQARDANSTERPDAANRCFEDVKLSTRQASTLNQIAEAQSKAVNECRAEAKDSANSDVFDEICNSMEVAGVPSR